MGKCESSLGGKKTGMRIISDRLVTTTLKVINIYWAFILVPALCSVHKEKQSFSVMEISRQFPQKGRKWKVFTSDTNHNFNKELQRKQQDMVLW